MKIEAYDIPGKHRTGYLNGLSVTEINEVLGFYSNCDDDPDKVVNSWGFKADGVHCGIWDYYGSYNQNIFSIYGSREIFVELFGEEHVE
jgi:hypothetical protein